MIQVTLSIKGAKEGVALNLPATPAEVSEACAWFDRLNIAPREVRIIGANSPVRNIYQYIARADIHSPDDVEKLNTLAKAIGQMDDRERHVFAGALDAESINGLDDVLKLSQHLNDYVILPNISNDTELGRFLVDSGYKDFPEEVQPYLDYCGDAILQKSVTLDCIGKKRKKNTGEAPMYYVQNNHPAIIDRVTFNKVQEELARRKTKAPGSAKSSITSTGKYSRYALTDVLICGDCGTRYRRVTWSRNGVKRIVWRCISRLDYGKKYCKDSPTIMEDKLQEAIVRAVNKFNEQDNATYKALMRATIGEALGLIGDPEEVDMLERKIEALNNKMLALVNESVMSGEGIEAHESEFMTLSQEAELLKQRIATIQESASNDNGAQNRLEQIQAIIAERENKRMEYGDSIVRQMVECIKVYPGGKLEIIFGGGYLVEESV